MRDIPNIKGERMYQSKDDTDMREIRRGEIYYIDLANIDYADSHISGKTRPGLVIQNNIGNDNSYNVIVALLTSVDKKPYPFQYKVTVNGRQNTVMFDQIMTIPKQNIEGKLGELTQQQIYESDISLMCSLNLLQYSITSLSDFDITNMITERTKNTESTYYTVDIVTTISEKENYMTGTIMFQNLVEFDPTITKDTGLDAIKDKLNNCVGLKFIANHIQF